MTAHLGLLIVPIVFGGISGLALGISAPFYWSLQALAILGTLFGTKQAGARSAAVPSALGGFTFGVALLAVRGLTGWEDKIDLGAQPAFLVGVTTVLATLFGMLGGGITERRARTRVEAAQAQARQGR